VEDFRSSRRGVRLREPIQVTVSFEENRLSEACLTSAYELALPLVQQEYAKRRSNKNKSGKWRTFENERLVN
jgi:hypothetical protein